MPYMILVYEPEEAYAGDAGQAALEAIVARHMALAEDLRARGVMKDGSGLQGIDTYYLVDVPNLDEALAIARRVPVIDGGKVEVRPLADY